MEVIVIRAFSGAGRKFIPGERVDATAWKNTDLLLEQRFIRLAGEGEKTVKGKPAVPAPSTSTKAAVAKSKKTNEGKPKGKRRVMPDLDDLIEEDGE